MNLYKSEVFEIQLIICIKYELALNIKKGWYAIKIPSNQPDLMLKMNVILDFIFCWALHYR